MKETDRYVRYVLLLLAAMCTMNLADRQILSVLVPLIKADLQLTDTEVGALSGTAFAIIYATVGIPIARWADRGNRVAIASWGLALWSAMTAFSGLVGSYLQLLLARMGVALGESGSTPTAHSLISDYLPPARRAAAIAAYSLGIPLGTTVGLLVGGWVGQFYGWRTAFFVLGLPGLALALLLRLTVREPARTTDDGRLVGTTPQPPWRDGVRALFGNRAFRHLAFAGGLLSFQANAGGAWIPSLLFRDHGMSLGEVGTGIAIASLIAGLAGAGLGGWLGTTVGARDRRWLAWLPGAAMAIGAPFWILGLYAGNPYLALFGFLGPAVAENVYFGPVNSLLQGMVMPGLRAFSSAVLLLCINLIGLGGGPLVVGWLSDRLGGSTVPGSLRVALLVAPVVCLWSAFHYWMAGRCIAAEMRSAS